MTTALHGQLSGKILIGVTVPLLLPRVSVVQWPRPHHKQLVCWSDWSWSACRPTGGCRRNWWLWTV